MLTLNDGFILFALISMKIAQSSFFKIFQSTLTPLELSSNAHKNTGRSLHFCLHNFSSHF